MYPCSEGHGHIFFNEVLGVFLRDRGEVALGGRGETRLVPCVGSVRPILVRVVRSVFFTVSGRLLVVLRALPEGGVPEELDDSVSLVVTRDLQ